MSRVERSALVRASAARMYALVNDVDAYPRRFDWCEGAAVLQHEPDLMVVRLSVRFGGLRLSFTTRNALVPDSRVSLALVDGPFRRLSGAWRFAALAEDACKVSRLLDFDVAGRLVGGALASGFRGLADRMVDDFVRAARENGGDGGH